MEHLKEYPNLGCDNRTLAVYISKRRIYIHTDGFEGTALQFLKSLWCTHTINQYAQDYVRTLKSYMQEHEGLYIQVHHRYLDDPTIWTDIPTASKQWMKNVIRDGWALQYIPEEHRSYDMCLHAVKQCGWTLQFVPEEHRSYDLCLSAVEQNGGTLKYVPMEHRSYDLCLSAVQQDRCALYFVPMEHRSKIKEALSL